MMVGLSNRSVQVKLSGAITTNPVHFICTYKVWSSWGESPGYGSAIGTISGTTPVTLLPEPTGGRVFQIISLDFYNGDTTSATINFHQDNGVDNTFLELSLPSGYMGTYATGGGFRVLDPTGSLAGTTPYMHCHWDGTDDATSITDEIAGTTWTFSNAKIATEQSKFGGSSVEFITGFIPHVNTNDLNAAQGWAASTESWTIEAWHRADVTGGNSWQVLDSTTGANFQALFNNTACTINGNAGSAAVMSVDTWYHFAIVQDTVAGTLSSYFDGNRVVTYGGAASANFKSIFFRTSTFGRTAWFDETRLISGALYSGPTYTIPTAPF